MTAGRVTLCIALAIGFVACSDDPDETSPSTEETSSSTTASTAPERPASTTTTAFDPASVEGEVEAAYLKSWDVYADAVYDLVLDEEALEEVYADDLLEVRRTEISKRIEEGRAAHVVVDHDYEIDFTGDDTAIVIDRYQNHQVLIDPDSKEPIEEDPDAAIVDAFSARRVSGHWVFVDLDRLA